MIPGAKDASVPPGAARSSLQKGDLGEFGPISWGCSVTIQGSSGKIKHARARCLSNQSVLDRARPKSLVAPSWFLQAQPFIRGQMAAMKLQWGTLGIDLPVARSSHCVAK